MISPTIKAKTTKIATPRPITVINKTGCDFARDTGGVCGGWSAGEFCDRGSVMGGHSTDFDDDPEAEESPPLTSTTVVEVTAELEQHRLDRLLAVALLGFSRTRLKALIEEGHVTAGGAAVTDPAARVKAGVALTVRSPAPASVSIAAQDIPLTIVHEDAHVIVIDKPAGLVVHPAAGNPDGTLVNALLAHCGASLSGIGGEARPGIVHRIDKDTSGLIVAAKTELAHRSLGRQFAAHAVERAYLACVWGAPREPSGTVSTQINRSPANRQKMAVAHSGGKHAITHYRVEKLYAPGRPWPAPQPDWTREPYGEWRRAAAASLLECRLETGRTHQVRVHLAHLGHPLIGDSVYGRPKTVVGLTIPIERQALHAAVLGFQHPKTHKQMRFESAPPADFQALLTALDNFTRDGRAAHDR
jgi:23S rRNA pseudouridine1911/1915/1917 synthase